MVVDKRRQTTKTFDATFLNDAFPVILHAAHFTVTPPAICVCVRATDEAHHANSSSLDQIDG